MMKKGILFLVVAFIVSVNVMAQEAAEEVPEVVTVEAPAEAVPVLPVELVGKWKLVSIGTPIIYEFTSDGRMILNGNEAYPVQVTCNGNDLTFTHSAGTGSATYKVKKDMLTFSKLKGQHGLPMGSFKRQ